MKQHAAFGPREHRSGQPTPAIAVPDSTPGKPSDLDSHKSIRTCGTTVDPEGERRSTVPFATAIKKFVKRETGIDINVHLFRHLAAKLYLQELSHDIETVRRILGHSSTATTVHAYADVQTASAFRRYDEVIASLQEQATALPKRKARARAGALA